MSNVCGIYCEMRQIFDTKGYHILGDGIRSGKQFEFIPVLLAIWCGLSVSWDWEGVADGSYPNHS